MIDGAAKLELQYKTVLDLGKFMYDSYFKLATMSFTLNSFLLGSLGVFLTQAAQIPDRLFSLAVGAMGVFGLVYNAGAVCTFFSLTSLAWSLGKKFGEIDSLVKTEVDDCRTTFSNGAGSASVFLTVLFFVLWMVFWGYLAIWHFRGQLGIQGRI